MSGHVNPPLCIFDLDGTLVDSLRDIAEALNECLGLLGIAPHPVERYRYMVGEGVPKLCQRALGESHPLYVQRLIELARARYRVRPLEHTRPYADTPEMVDALRAHGCPLAVLTNKPHAMAVRIVREFWAEGTFGAIQGYETEQLRKPDPTTAIGICRRLGVPCDRAWLIGDTPTDVETARRAGMRMLAVTWGFRTRADLEQAGATLIVDTPSEALDALLNGGSFVSA